MPKIEFIQDKTVSRPDGSGTKYEAGKVYEMPAASCEHHKSRGTAKAAPDKAKVAEPIEVDAQGRPMEETTATAEKAGTDEKAAERQKLAKRSAVKIPDDRRGLSDEQIIALGASVSDNPVRTKDEAAAAIVAELSRRAS